MFLSVLHLFPLSLNFFRLSLLSSEMSTQRQSNCSSEFNSNCIFCQIVGKKSEASIRYEDSNFIAFDDISPASDVHILIIPKKHIKDVKSLTKNDLSLVENMKQIAIDLVKEKQFNMNTTRLGFHLPPFNSIGHLHLHLIYPTNNMTFLKRVQFRPGSWWFTEIEPFLDSLRAST
ncbi:adenosine 5'-monophosphoramidase HINT3-like [Panonychus citri]|uniref:adenosine 5'-monophosphoramidase HINT3-like n=1 Tax=Panonychus citri TaxID=50023 RepID=UPI002306FD3F|nr:adenosine 5'-monophosphoramidase HINT3-like [Panonychus citri]